MKVSKVKKNVPSREKKFENLQSEPIGSENIHQHRRSGQTMYNHVPAY